MFAKNIKLNMVFQYIDRLNAPERMGKQILFFRYITKKLQAYPKKDVLAVFRLRLFFHSSVLFIHF